MHLHASAAHTFSLPSSQPVTMLLLSGLLHTAVIPPLCPSSVAVQHALGCDSCCRSHTFGRGIAAARDHKPAVPGAAHGADGEGAAVALKQGGSTAVVAAV